MWEYNSQFNTRDIGSTLIVLIVQTHQQNRLRAHIGLMKTLLKLNIAFCKTVILRKL